MKTKILIKTKALELFNDLGVVNVTLRQVAESLGKSYGNITYHYHTKEELIRELYADMSLKMQSLTAQLPNDRNLLEIVLLLPNYTYRVSLEYLFFFVDYAELQRNFPSFMQAVEKDLTERAQQVIQLLYGLRAQGFLPADTDEATLRYIMELSGAMRTVFFQKFTRETATQKLYVDYTNRLLFPYLTEKGKTCYTVLEQAEWMVEL